MIRTTRKLFQTSFKTSTTSSILQKQQQLALVANFSTQFSNLAEKKEHATTFNITSVSKKGSVVVANFGTYPSLSLTMDEPVAFGGTNTGPTPLELLLSSLSGCEIVNARYAAKSMKMDIKSVVCSKMAGAIDFSSMGSGIAPSFKTIDMVFEVETDESDARIDELKERVEKNCPIYNILKAAKVQMNCVWKRKV